MEALGYTVVAFGILAFGLVSARAERSMITPPMAFVFFGYLVSQEALGLIRFSFDGELVRLVAELALILILFTDASRIDLRLLWKEHHLPVRLLAIGLPLTVVAGATVAVVLFETFSIWEAILLAIVLAPTDAALGQAVISSPRVPVRIRQALNVESGLNDGIALPFLLIFLSAATASASLVEDATYWLVFTANQIVLGPVVGIAVGYLGAKLLQSANRAGWINEVFLKLSAVGLALFAFGAAELLHGNGFIAAFAAGLMMGNVARDICPKLYQFGEVEGQLLALLTFMIFGGLMVPEWLGSVTWTTVIYALLSLTLIRALPVAVSLVGLKLQAVTVLFLGWFGPRGIASILYALLILEESTILPTETLLPTVTLTVLFSVFLHGLTAHPGAIAYAAALGSMPETELPEHEEIVEMPLRLSTMR